MAECDLCEIAEKGEKIFEDGKSFAAMSPEPASRGHAIIAPKEHFTILEQVPDFITGHLFSLANKISTAMFETLRVHGTNIIIENGSAAGQKVAHVSINVIPRSENDGLGFSWTPTTVSDEEMSAAELQLNEETANIGGFRKEETKLIAVEKEETVIPETEEDYQLRQLRRIP